MEELGPILIGSLRFLPILLPHNHRVRLRWVEHADGEITGRRFGQAGRHRGGVKSWCERGGRMSSNRGSFLEVVEVVSACRVHVPLDLT